MTDLPWALLWVAGYLIAFLLGVTALAGCRARPAGRPPPLELRVRRGPAESRHRAAAAFDRAFVFRVAGAGVIPVAAAAVVLFAFNSAYRPSDQGRVSLAIVAAAVVFAAAVAAMVRLLWGVLRHQAELSLDCLGDRVVGEAMEPLLAGGYRVFHDVPAGIGGVLINVDHVAVGPNGVFAIETRTQSQGGSRDGFDHQRVIFDGRQLIWPWGEEVAMLQETEARATGLSRWLTASSGQPVTARPILVLPGWLVLIQAVGRVAVVNPQQLAAAVMRGGDRGLSPAQIELLAGHLDTLCRDVGP